MFKDNGREKPAPKSAVASKSGKEMVCPKCNKKTVIAKVSFANTICPHCGDKLNDSIFESSSKYTN